MQQFIYIKLDSTCQEWIKHAWGTEISRKNMLGIIIGPYLEYTSQVYFSLKEAIQDPTFMKLNLVSKLNGKDLRQGICIPIEYHHDIELSIKYAMREDFHRYMRFCRKLTDRSIDSLIRSYITMNKLPCNNLDIASFKKQFYNNREQENTPKSFSMSYPVYIT